METLVSERVSDPGSYEILVNNGFVTSSPVNFIVTSTPQPTPSIISSDPPNGAIDARKAPDMTWTSVTGWRSIELKFSGSVAGIKPIDFSVITSGGETPVVVDTPPKTNTTSATMDTLSLDLDRPIPVNQRTRITHKPSGSSICLGFLPGNANGDDWTNSLDVSFMNGVLAGTLVNQPLYRTDINRDEVVNQSDITKINEIISTTPVTQRRLPACPSASL